MAGLGRGVVWVLAVEVLALAGCVTTGPKAPDGKHIFEGNGFTVILPADVEGVKEHGKDYTTYEFKRQGKDSLLLWAAAGWHYSPDAKEREEMEPTRINGYRAWEQLEESEAGFSRHEIVKLAMNPFWRLYHSQYPPHVIFSYENLNDEEKSVADAIVESVRRVKN